jgi:hypothetical protein
MTGIIRRKVYTAVLESEPAGVLVVNIDEDKWPLQIKLSTEELAELHTMIEETLAELARRQKAH